ncbi:MAG: formate dehydrogenase accessory sulfurtransferase FdhD [Saprospiraceae bacterium]|nr:formate dehydrogenase accessory sulfurtransferase FdhD [Saprospiraceae bacterium]
MLINNFDIGQKKITIHRYRNGVLNEFPDQVAEEAPVEIRLRHFTKEGWKVESVSVTMRTPGQDHDLSVGFLFTESIISSFGDVDNIKDVDENIVEVIMNTSFRLGNKSISRNFYISSSCGVCGKASIDSVKVENVFLPWSSDLKVYADIITGLREKLSHSQSLFNTTGGIHASALFDKEGNLKLLREDVGRHNALDKLIGAFLRENTLPVSDFMLMVSGRASFELVQKAAMAGIPVLVAVGAPSSLAVELAEEQGMTLIGFLKEDRFNIYSRPDRILI